MLCQTAQFIFTPIALCVQNFQLSDQRKPCFNSHPVRYFCGTNHFLWLKKYTIFHLLDTPERIVNSRCAAMFILGHLSTQDELLHVCSFWDICDDWRSPVSTLVVI